MEKQKTRDEISNDYKWDLSGMFESDLEWEKLYNELLNSYGLITKYKGTIMDSADNLSQTLEFSFDVEEKMESLYVYAKIRVDEDLSNSKYQKMEEKIMNLYNLFKKEEAYVYPEILKSDFSIVQKYIEQLDSLKKYEFLLINIFRNKEHTLTDNEEQTLAAFSNIASNFSKSSNFIMSSEINFEDIIDEDGNKINLTPSNLLKYEKSVDRRVREEAYNSFVKGYGSIINTLSANFVGNAKYEELESNLRGFKSSLDADFFELNVDQKFFDNLILVVNENIGIYQKYLKLLKKTLNVETLEPYDLKMTLTEATGKNYSYEDAKKIILDSFSIYGEDYIKVLNLAFDKKWIDVFPSKNKETGWYSWGAYLTHPIVLCNFNSKLYDVSALAHELGHLVNYYYNSKNNYFPYSDHSILEAEVASLTNEIVLSINLLNKTDEKEEKLEILSNMIDLISSNLFGATKGTEFLLNVHEMILNNEPLTSEVLCSEWKKQYNKYNGDIVIDNYNYGWARVSHFYRNYYYYKYATGVSVAIYNAKRLLNKDQDVIDNYIEYLKRGSSDYPINNLKLIGINLDDKTVFEEAVKFFDSLLDQFEEIYNS